MRSRIIVATGEGSNNRCNRKKMFSRSSYVTSCYCKKLYDSSQSERENIIYFIKEINGDKAKKIYK